MHRTKIGGVQDIPTGGMVLLRAARVNLTRAGVRHPGVVLRKRVRPNGLVRYRACWFDPDVLNGDGMPKECTFTFPHTHGTSEARKAWAVAKSRELAHRKADRAAGIAAPSPGEPIGAAIDDFLRNAEGRLSKRTREVYASALGRLRDWAPGAQVARATDLTKARLAAFKDHLVNLPRNAKRGGPVTRRGAATRELRSPVSVNTEMRGIKTLLNE